MKRSINAWAFPKDMTFEDIFREAKEKGFECIELNVDAIGANAHSFNFESIIIVTGPSFTNSTFISAPNTPFLVGFPSACPTCSQ